MSFMSRCQNVKIVFRVVEKGTIVIYKYIFIYYYSEPNRESKFILTIMTNDNLDNDDIVLTLKIPIPSRVTVYTYTQMILTPV